MNYYQVNIPIPGNQDMTDILIAQLAEVGFESFEENEEFVIAYIPEKDYLPEVLASIDYCSAPDILSQTKHEFIEDRNWNEVWESNYPPVMITDRCIVRAPFHEAPEGIEFDIVVKPKMAFGTAHHETTAQMLEVMLDADVKGKKVLDMGCGSGVLAILCAMKGAAEITAIDIDEWSYSNTLENAEINQVTNIIPLLGDASLLRVPMLFEVILANINKNILLRDMESYVGVLKSGGSIYFSGFYTEDLADITNKASENKLKFIQSQSDNNWVVAHFIKA